MIRSVLRLKASSLEQLDKDLKPSKYELNIMGEVVEILTPFEIATKHAEGQNQVTASLVVVCVRGLRSQVEELQEKFDCKLVSQLLESIDKRLSKYESRPLFTHAAALDPRWKLEWATPEEVAEIRRSIISKASVLLPPQPVSTSTDSSDPPPKKKSKLFSFMARSTVPAPSSEGAISVATQVNKYFSEPCLDEDVDPLQFWQQHSVSYPQLSTLACKYLAVPASSAPVERVFSISGKIFRPDRCNLSDKRFEELMFLRCNAPAKHTS
jgi:hypothetical protein